MTDAPALTAHIPADLRGFPPPGVPGGYGAYWDSGLGLHGGGYQSSVHARVGVGKPACEERIVLEGGDPGLPQPVGKTAGHGGGRFLPVMEAGEVEVQVPVEKAWVRQMCGSRVSE